MTNEQLEKGNNLRYSIDFYRGALKSICGAVELNPVGLLYKGGESRLDEMVLLFNPMEQFYGKNDISPIGESEIKELQIMTIPIHNKLTDIINAKVTELEKQLKEL